MSVILEHVSKAYGRQKALDDIGFRLEEGEICGFLGPNGAGKSTTMKIITGCLNDYQGEVRIKEMNLRENPLKIKAIIGYYPNKTHSTRICISGNICFTWPGFIVSAGL